MRFRGGSWSVGTHDGKTACHVEVVLLVYCSNDMVWYVGVISCTLVWSLVEEVVWSMERGEEQDLPFYTSQDNAI